MSSETTSRTYTGWQQEKTAILFGMSGQRCFALGVAVLLAIWPLAASRLSLGLVTWPVAALMVALAFIRIAGRTTDEWATAFVSYQLLRMRGQTRFASAAFAPADKTAPTAPAPMDLPGVLAPLTILQADTGNGDVVAVIHHRRDRTYTAVAKIRFPGIGLVDRSRRDQRVAGWGGLLASLCTEGNAIIRVQALQRLLPESGASLHRWHADHLSQSAPKIAAEITSSLLSTATLATSQREAYLAFTMDERRAGSAIRGAGGGSAGAAAVLLRHLRALTGSIGSADLQVEGWLGPRDLAEVLRSAFDPHSGRSLAEVRAGAVAAATVGRKSSGEPGVNPALAGPAAAETMPGHYAHDGAVSATYWVHSWPDTKVFSTALAPLLGEGSHRRAFSLHVEPLGPREAKNAVMRERTARDVAVQLRRKSGQIIPADERAALVRADSQDAERAAGHGLIRFTAYCTVTVTDPADLEDACSSLEADAAAANIEIRRMWLAQDIGFAMSTLPVGLGLPKKRW